nr:protein FAR1-RELATED SEQUENCE 5-like [Aegilops tauschii subsp. strangulata]
MSGGLQYMGHTSRDWVNKKQKFAREESQDDVKKLLDFFEMMQKINPEFFYDYDVDADNRVRNVFWANASCKGSYEDFGDCVTFDTTYKTKKFHMPLGVFVGVNHHLQSTIFAVALVQDETIPSFEWVFKTFLRSTKTTSPCCIRREKLKDDLNAVLNHPVMPSEFERAWKDLIQRYNLQDDEVMNSLWEDRHEWISAYYKEVFCARMTSTQRSESMNRILKQNFVKGKHDLHLFAQQVDKCIQTRKAVEHAETVANESEVKTTTQFGFEVQLSKEYTRVVFADFKETLYRSTAFRAERCPENPTKYLKPAFCELSIGKKHPVLLFQLSAAERCTVFDNFLADPRYTFAGFSIDSDKKG